MKEIETKKGSIIINDEDWHYIKLEVLKELIEKEQDCKLF